MQKHRDAIPVGKRYRQTDRCLKDGDSGQAFKGDADLYTAQLPDGIVKVVKTLPSER